ncbi:hypothetical protein IMSHALPRED_009628 [Imshaugia aleurites]|uniref:SnoaL-like domain-containing protein n=1 Tax=Imshaugia aleurites TaxID=172621 RepID=A0A8H3FXR8_9LECA|nr:hypothetical protein IMSHALPRED_009628 [Imshaugia aleurites]
MPHPATTPISLTALTPREAITDAIYRAVIGLDRNDSTMFNSAWASESESESPVSFLVQPNSTTINGLTAIRAQIFDHVGPMDTTHMLSNIRVEYKAGADTASLTAYALAQHCPPGRGKEADGPKYLVGGEYRVDVVRGEEGGEMVWKMKKWVLDIIWTQGDASVMQRPG